MINWICVLFLAEPVELYVHTENIFQATKSELKSHAYEQRISTIYL